ncbi:MAG: hypothetical protein ACJA1B_000808 [Polaribacter sp.]|jgi:hypothetical protein
METLISEFSTGLVILQISLLVSILLWIYCLINILKYKFENNDKLIWILVVIFLPILGSILYLSIGKRKNLNIKNL